MSDSSAAPPIEAATVVLLRDGPAGGGLQVLMLQRNDRGQFGGMWVFPGGRLEAADVTSAHPDDVIAQCEPPHGSGELAAPCGAERRGYRAAAVRETAEEAGIELAAAELVHHSHWLPPPVRAKRFSTHFFLCEAPADLADVTVDQQEIFDHKWLAPAEALRRRSEGEMRFVTPTFVTLWMLQGVRRAGDALAAARAPRCFHTELLAGPPHDPGFVAVYPGDAAYPDGRLDTPGPRRRCSMLESTWTWEESAG